MRSERAYLSKAALAASFLAAGSCDPFHTGFAADESPIAYHAHEQRPPPRTPLSLRVMTYNIKFGGGRIDFFFDCHGDRVLMEKSEVLDNLRGLAELINRVDPDVLLLQEVEINSKRSAYVDQMDWLVNHTRFNHAVYASAWRADYVPSDGLGAVDMGNAILSKYPLANAVRIALPLIDEQSALERYFYLRRNLLKATVEIEQRGRLAVMVTHTSAYSKDGTKLRQIERFEQEMDTEAAQGLVVGGGDLNTLPPGSEQTHDFQDSVCSDVDFIADDYREESEWLVPLYDRYTSAVPLAEYQLHNHQYFTHTTDKLGFFNRKLDYLFTNAIPVGPSHRTYQRTLGGSDPMQLSDHAPISFVVVLE